MDTIVHLLTEWGYIGMFISAFWAGTILPFCSEAVLIACVGLGLDPVLSVLSTTAGNALGGITCYWIGYLGKMEWIEKYMRIKHKQLERADRFIQKQGYWIAFFSFVPIIGGPILVALGLMRAPVCPVATSMTLGKMLRYIILVAATLGIINITL